MDHGIKYYWKACLQGLFRNLIAVSWKWYCKSWPFPWAYSHALTKIEHLQFLLGRSCCFCLLTSDAIHWSNQQLSWLASQPALLLQFALNTPKGKLEATHGFKDEVVTARSMSSESAPDTAAPAPPPRRHRGDWAVAAQGEPKEPVRETVLAHVVVDTRR